MRNGYMFVNFDDIADIEDLFNTVGNSIHTSLVSAHGDKYDYYDYISRCEQMLDYLRERVDNDLVDEE